MNIASAIPKSLIFVALAERIYCEREILERIEAILNSAQLEGLGEDRVLQFKFLCAEHYGLLGRAVSAWQLGAPRLEEMLATISKVGPGPINKEDMTLISQMDALLELFTEMDALDVEADDLEGYPGSSTLYLGPL